MVQSKKNSAKKSNAASSPQKDTPQNNFDDFMENEADKQKLNTNISRLTETAF